MSEGEVKSCGCGWGSDEENKQGVREEEAMRKERWRVIGM